MRLPAVPVVLVKDATTSFPAQPMAARVLVAITVGMLAALVVAYIYSGMAPGQAPDFTVQWLAARALLEGRDPYAAVPAVWKYEYFYPLPAAIVALPFGVVALEWARVVFVGVGAGLLAYALSARGWWALLWLVSGPALSAYMTGQWSLLFVGAIALPALRGLWIVKPTVGLAYLAGYGVTRGAVALGAGLTLVAFLVQPDWPVR